jgi:23S rRNA pseudouridine2605 synthase
MNMPPESNMAEATLSDAQAQGADSATDPQKPARRRRVSKSAVDPSLTEPALQPLADSVPAPDAPAPAARVRRSRAKADESATVDASPPAPRSPRSKPRRMLDAKNPEPQSAGVAVADELASAEPALTQGIDGVASDVVSSDERNLGSQASEPMVAVQPLEPSLPEAARPAVAMPDAGERFAEVLSGAFDTAYEPDGAQQSSMAASQSEPAQAPKRVLSPEPEAPKLHKVLAQSGIGSRRDMEKLIEEGLVEVNGQVAHTGQRVAPGDQVKVRGKPVRLRLHPGPARILAYHKPVGEVVTHDDPQQRPTVFRNLPRLAQGKWQSVGRLDINTEGLLLFTNSGELANQLMHPRFGVEREYAVRVLGTLDVEARTRLLAGVEVDGQVASFKSIENGGGEGVNHWYRVVITEGRNREVRKLFDSVGLAVSRLIRIRYGTVVLPRGLKRGVFVDLPDSDVRAIRQLATSHLPRGAREGLPDEGEARGSKARGKKRGPRGIERASDRKSDRSTENAGDRQGQRNGDRDAQRGPKPKGPDSKARRGGQERRMPNTETARASEGEDWDDDFDPARIPNPLEQTFDKRFVKNPRSPAGGRGFRNGGGGFGAGGSAAAPSAKPARGGPREPDPLQTSVGYIGADAFHQRGGRGGRGGSGGGRRGGR